MAVMQNSIIFGGVDSADFGIYIGGEGTFNAPKRDVEMISIPGRNGAFALDKGRFENIEVTYSAFNYETDLATFSANLEAFRNAICSQKGYQRLTDTFHPDEYRMAAYIDGLEIKPIDYNTASTFDIKFDCKPQRFLTSGEDPITIGEWHDTETASGTIASFEAVEGDGVKSLVADIEPIQDLHGYDKPWAGGAGKNKLPMTVSGIKAANTYGTWSGNAYTLNGITFTLQTSDGTNVNGITVNGTATATSGLEIKPAISLSGDYIVNGCPTGGANNAYRLDARPTSGGVLVEEYGNGSSFTYTGDVYCYIRIQSGVTVENKVFKPMIRLSSVSDATWQPYSNICPISGYDSVVTSVSPTTSAPDATTYTTNLSSTRYGGTLDVVSGVLTVTHGYVDLGSLTWNYDTGTTRLYSNVVSGIKIPAGDETPDALSDRYVVTKAYGQTSGANGTISIGGTGLLWVYDTSAGTSGSAFKTAVTGSTFVYELATPTTVQLTAQEVELLVGLNQIWANSGDVTVEYGTMPNVAYNPTLFEARPMLEVEGYGEITIGDETITLNNATLGDVIIAPTASTTTRMEMTVPLDVSNINSGDTITINKVSIQTHYYLKAGYTCNCTVASTSNVNVTTSLNGRVRNYVMENVTLQYRQTETKTGTATINNEYAQNGGSASTIVTTEGIEVDYQPLWKSLKVSLVLGNVFVPCFAYQALKYSLSTSEIHANSSKSALGDPTYIDLDIGEAYLVNDGVPVSLNNTATFPAELPTLKSGSNSITFDNTITDLKIIPRWWKV